jgi:hypothetical protein
MDTLKGSLRFIPLPAVTQFIAGLGSTGHLKLVQGAWLGDISLRDGHVVAVQLGTEYGRAAMDGLMLALSEADFVFVDEPVETTDDALFSREELEAYLAGLSAERERLQLPENALDSVPYLIDQPEDDSTAGQVTIHVSALQVVPFLPHGHTLEQIARQRGLARTLREIAVLYNAGLVRLEAVRAGVGAATTPGMTESDSIEAEPSLHAGGPQSLSAHIRPLRTLFQPRRRPTWWHTPVPSSSLRDTVIGFFVISPSDQR